MLKQKLAGVVAVGLLLGAGAANAAGLVASTNETASSPHAYQASVKPARTVNAGSTESIFATSQNETVSSPHPYRHDVQPGARIKTGNMDSVFPSSPNEVV